MVAVGALHHLTHLSLTVAPARLTTPGMRLNLGALTQLTALQVSTTYTLWVGITRRPTPHWHCCCYSMWALGW
jgi:hypothetical protein